MRSSAYFVRARQSVLNREQRRSRYSESQSSESCPSSHIKFVRRRRHAVWILWQRRLSSLSFLGAAFPWTRNVHSQSASPGKAEIAAQCEARSSKNRGRLSRSKLVRARCRAGATHLAITGSALLLFLQYSSLNPYRQTTDAASDVCQLRLPFPV